jgi:hypothetical protein
MSPALACDEYEAAYHCFVKTSVDAANEYYSRELAKLGWKLFAIGTNDYDMAWLFFTKDNSSLTVLVTSRGDVTSILIVAP